MNMASADARDPPANVESDELTFGELESAPFMASFGLMSGARNPGAKTRQQAMDDELAYLQTSFADGSAGERSERSERSEHSERSASSARRAEFSDVYYSYEQPTLADVGQTLAEVSQTVADIEKLLNRVQDDVSAANTIAGELSEEVAALTASTKKLTGAVGELAARVKPVVSEVSALGRAMARHEDLLLLIAERLGVRADALRCLAAPETGPVT